MSYQPGTPLTQGPAYAPTAQAEYANWLYRVGSYFIDALITSAVVIVVRILIGAAGQTDSFGNPQGVGLLLYLLSLDGLPCYLGYLWPLWDSKRQTFADKIVGTVVVRV